MVVLGPVSVSVIRRLWFALSSVPAGTGVLVSPTIGPVNSPSPSPRPKSGFFPMFVGPRMAEGLSKILVIEVGGRVLGQLVDTKALAVAINITVAVAMSVAMTMSVSVSLTIAVAMEGSVSVSVAVEGSWSVSVSVALAVRDCRDVVKLAGCW